MSECHFNFRPGLILAPDGATLAPGPFSFETAVALA
jgi:hypothetical protein